MPRAIHNKQEDEPIRLRYFPRPFEDELLYSVLCRYYVLSRPPGTWTNMLEDLLGKSNFETSGAYLQGGIATLVQRLPESHELADPICAAFSHTALNYCTYFHKAWQRAETVQRIVAGDSVGQLFFYLGFRGTSLSRPRPLRYCESCAREDFERVGTTYWHLSHHLPGTFVCSRHGLPLVHGCTACHEFFQSRKDVRLPPARPCGIKGHSVSGFDIPFEHSHQRLQDLAIAAHRMSMNPAGFPARWRTAVRAALAEDGFARGTALKPEAITRALDDRYGSSMVTWCGFKRSADYVGSTSTVGRMLANTSYRHNTFRQLMVSMLLGPSLEAVEDRLRSMPGALDPDEERPDSTYEDDDHVCRVVPIDFPGGAMDCLPTKQKRKRRRGKPATDERQQVLDLTGGPRVLRPGGHVELMDDLPEQANYLADQETADAVLRTAEEIRRLSPQLQVTRTLVRRYARLPTAVRIKPKQWPLTNQALNRSIEDQADFVDRRVRAALEQLSKKKESICLNDLVKVYQVPADHRQLIRERLPVLCEQYGMRYLRKAG